LIIAEDDDENDDDGSLFSSSRRVVVFDALVVFCPIDEEATNNGAFSEEGKAPTLDITSSFSSKFREPKSEEKKNSKKTPKKKEGKRVVSYYVYIVCQYVEQRTNM